MVVYSMGYDAATSTWFVRSYYYNLWEDGQWHSFPKKMVRFNSAEEAAAFMKTQTEAQS